MGRWKISPPKVRAPAGIAGLSLRRGSEIAHVTIGDAGQRDDCCLVRGDRMKIALGQSRSPGHMSEAGAITRNSVRPRRDQLAVLKAYRLTAGQSLHRM